MKAACKKYNSSVLSWVAKTVASSINYFMHRIRGQSISVQKKMQSKVAKPICEIDIRRGK